MRIMMQNTSKTAQKRGFSLDGKVILVTGGTGTFGKAFITEVLKKTKAKKIIVFSRDEFKQNVMQQDFKDPRLNFFLGDVRDLPRLERAFNAVDVVVHAAALKQVPALEYNPLEAVKTNIIGTQNVIDAALNKNVERVLFISTDKAVHPINLYGSTKLCAERLIIAANSYRGENGKTRFSLIRYGNVVGSRGSLIELIQKQKPTGVITLTDERMTRFLIPITKVIGMVIDALDMMRSGEIFVPKMKSLKITDVIKKLAPRAKIKVIGIRPGEKIHEMLITEHEARRTKDAGHIYIVLPESTQWKYEHNFDSLPDLSPGIMYTSDHEHFLVGADKVGKVIEMEV
jgi:UDP-N-acetylglucosamine 4,6-dehydratase